MLTRDQILGADDLKRETIAVPEWGGDVVVSEMTGATRDAWEQTLMGEGAGKMNIANLRARLFAFGAVDEKGNLLFTPEDAEALGKKSAKALERCVKAIQRLNGLTEDEVEKIKKN